MAYFCFGPCISCRRMFTFNPERVPSTAAITGEREPLCKTCIQRINAKRIEMGLEPFQILPGAYDAEPEPTDTDYDQ